MLDPDAARNYTALLADIRNMEREIAAPEYENQLQSYQNMRSQVQDQISRQQQERETLLQKIASGRQSLAGAQFSDENSVTAYRDETKLPVFLFKEKPASPFQMSIGEV